ncbi:MAG TPA: site-specific integrase [Deinococcales bacterium]|nr:site-specific integrase [Deinococcales bacterium]
MESLEGFRDYLLHRRGSSERTVRAYLTDVTMALADIRSFEPAAIESYLSSLAKRGTARSTVARKLAALRAYGDYLREGGQRRDNPAQRVAAPHRSYRVASDEFSRRRDRTLVEVARATGLEPDDLVSLNAEDVDWRANLVRLHDLDSVRVAGLGGSSRLLRAYLGGRGRGPLFLSSSGDRLPAKQASEVLAHPPGGDGIDPLSTNQ